jgi:hypothetical protein
MKSASKLRDQLLFADRCRFIEQKTVQIIVQVVGTYRMETVSNLSPHERRRGVYGGLVGGLEAEDGLQ